MMARSFWEMKTGSTLHIDFAGVLPGLLDGEGGVSLTLQQKKGRSARFAVVADERVSLDLDPPHGVKLEHEQ